MEGHNPSASLLPAASGPIVAMQGGGYDPTASLLPASAGAIQPMQGGAHGSTNTMLPAAEGRIEPMKGGADDEGGAETPFSSSSTLPTSPTPTRPPEAAILAAAETEAARVVAITRQAEEEATKRVIVEAAEAEAAQVVAAATAAATAAPAPSAAATAPTAAATAPTASDPTASATASGSPSVPPSVPLPSFATILSYLKTKGSPLTVTVSNTKASIHALTSLQEEGPGLHEAVKTRGIDFSKITLDKVETLRTTSP